MLNILKKAFSKNKNILTASLLVFSSIWFIAVIYQHRNLYLQKYNPGAAKRAYEASQWMVPNSKHPISDEMFYTYAAYRYMHGTSPILINPETPPFGKYMIGLSLLFFSNERIISVLSGVVVLMLVYAVTRHFSSALAASIAVALTTTNTLFADQLIHAPQLDIQQAWWLLAFILAFLKWEQTRKWWFMALAGICLGLFISIKVAAYNFVFMMGILGIYFMLNWKKFRVNLVPFAVMVAATGLTFVATYIPYFSHGGTLRGFAGTQKWIFLFYRNSTIDMTRTFGSYLSLIFINRWRFWSSGYPFLPYESWSVQWPALFILSLIACLRLIRHKKPLIIILTFIAYNLFLLVTPIFPRYLFILFVFGSIIIPLGLAKQPAHEKK